MSIPGPITDEDIHQLIADMARHAYRDGQRKNPYVMVSLDPPPIPVQEGRPVRRRESWKRASIVTKSKAS